MTGVQTCALPILHGMPGIKEVGIIGVQDDILGQAIKAFVALEADSDLNEKKIKKYCLLHLESFMVPNEIIFLKKLPKTSNGKIDKNVLQDMVVI